MELTLGVTLAVLGAGFLHASWNALLKSSAGGDVLLDTAAVVAGSSIWGLVAAAVRAVAGPGGVEIHRRVVDHPFRLLRDAGRRPIAPATCRSPIR